MSEKEEKDMFGGRDRGIYIEERKNHSSEDGILLASGLLQTGVKFNLSRRFKLAALDKMLIQCLKY